MLANEFETRIILDKPSFKDKIYKNEKSQWDVRIVLFKKFPNRKVPRRRTLEGYPLIASLLLLNRKFLPSLDTAEGTSIRKSSLKQSRLVSKYSPIRDYITLCKLSGNLKMYFHRKFSQTNSTSIFQ